MVSKINKNNWNNRSKEIYSQYKNKGHFNPVYPHKQDKHKELDTIQVIIDKKYKNNRNAQNLIRLESFL